MDDETIRRAAKQMRFSEMYNAGPAVKARIRGGPPFMNIDLRGVEERTLAWALQQDAHKATISVPSQAIGAGLWMAMAAYSWWKCFCGATTHSASYESSTLSCEHCGWHGLRTDLYLGKREGFSETVP